VPHVLADPRDIMAALLTTPPPPAEDRDIRKIVKKVRKRKNVDTVRRKS
jgi:hypothetical protein